MRVCLCVVFFLVEALLYLNDDDRTACDWRVHHCLVHSSTPRVQWGFSSGTYIHSAKANSYSYNTSDMFVSLFTPPPFWCLV